MIFFATPSHKGDVGKIANWAASMTTALKLEGASAGIVSNCPWIDAARADLVAAFLKSNCGALFFRDDDISIFPKTLQAMIDQNRPIVTVPYRMRQAPHNWVTLGLGCVLIQRRVIEEMTKAHPELEYDQDGEARWALFHPILENRRLLKEDAAFWRRAGAPYVLAGHQIDHGGVIGVFNGEGAEPRNGLGNARGRSQILLRST